MTNPAHARLTRRFAAACLTGDVAAVRDLLRPEVVVFIDGGGKVSPPSRAVRGPGEVAPFVVELLGGRPDGQVTVEQVNGGAGIVSRRAGDARAVACLGVTDAKVAVVWIVVNPDKLRQWRRG